MDRPSSPWYSTSCHWCGHLIRNASPVPPDPSKFVRCNKVSKCAQRCRRQGKSFPPTQNK